MKKFKKILTIISSAIIAISSGVISVSAAFENKEYYQIKSDAFGNNIPYLVQENIFYKGIVVTMPDDIVPTSDEIGIDCKISEYNAINHGLIKDVQNIDCGWEFEETVEPEANQYVLETAELMSEDEAIKFSEKLVIRGIVEKAEVLYDYLITKAEPVVSLSEKTVSIVISFNNNDSVNKFNIENFPEITEYLGFTKYEYDFSGELTAFYSCSLENSKYIIDENSNYPFDLMQIFDDINYLNKILSQKYNEFKNISLNYKFLYSDDFINAVYSIEPKWGDATNDDIIDLYDAIEIAKYIMNISDMDEDSILLADINRDGVTDLYDAIEIAKTLLPR